MGYRRQRKLYRLRFEDMPGLLVVMRAPSIAQMTALATAADAMNGDSPDMTVVDDMFRRFASCLTEWNLEDEEGRTIPATYEGVSDQDVDFLVQIIHAWLDAVVTVDPTSKTPSSNGSRPDLEASLPMAIHSTNQLT